ncbi:MAG: CocE/NonD family hydrolase [Thermomicrobiales bacterium]
MEQQRLSAPVHDVVIQRGVPIPMRDGVVLRADLYRPHAGGRYPVIIERVAYELTNRCRYLGEFFAQRGYVFLGQNVRGRFGSEGRWHPLRDDGWGTHPDGYDTIEWAAAQPWSSGKVGMVDGSYSGFTQYAVAPTRPPHLTALYVRMGGADVYRDFMFPGGAYALALHRGWALQQDAPAGAVGPLDEWQWHLPLRSCPPLEGRADWYFEDLQHIDEDAYWRAVSVAAQAQEIDTPITHLGGWFDAFLSGTLRAFTSIKAHGRTEATRRAQRLIIGPWIHGPRAPYEQRAGALDFGPDAAFDLDADRLRWYDYWLQGVDNGALDGPAVRLFVMGANRWREYDTWPPPEVTYRPLYFRAGPTGSANSLNDGALSFTAPETDEPPDTFTYDPAEPIPSLIWYTELGPADHRPVEAQMLTYTTPPLAENLTVIGPVTVVLYGVSSARDTDWVARLSDVWPDGRSLSLCDGILRARYRTSFATPMLLRPGEVARFTINLGATAYVFAAGHRLRVAITSSDFPRYDRNLNTGGEFGTETAGIRAENTVFHDEMRASHIALPTIEDAR